MTRDSFKKVENVLIDTIIKMKDTSDLDFRGISMIPSLIHSLVELNENSYCLIDADDDDCECESCDCDEKTVTDDKAYTCNCNRCDCETKGMPDIKEQHGIEALKKMVETLNGSHMGKSIIKLSMDIGKDE